MLNARPIDIETFHRLALRAGTVVEVHDLAPPTRLVEVVVDVGKEEYRALVTPDVLPSGGNGPWIGAQVVVIEDLFPMSCGSETSAVKTGVAKPYTTTLLTTGEPERIVILSNDLPDGVTLF